jgi:hypothetical protein
VCVEGCVGVSVGGCVGVCGRVLVCVWEVELGCVEGCVGVCLGGGH